MSIYVTISQNGRMSLPADVRRRLGVGKGGDLLLEETADGIVLRTTAQAVAKAQELARKFTEGKIGTSVDDFLAGRRADSGE